MGAPYSSLAAAYDNVGITDNSNPAPGNFDGTAALGILLNHSDSAGSVSGRFIGGRPEATRDMAR